MNPDRLPSPQNANRLVTVAPVGAATNKSGMEPVGTKVLVLPDEVAEKTAGGIYVPEKVKEQNDFAVCTGTLVSVGGAAFSDWPHSASKWPGYTPKAGDRVYMAKYAGVVIAGKDGRSYRLCQDTDIAGLETAS